MIIHIFKKYVSVTTFYHEFFVPLRKIYRALKSLLNKTTVKRRL